MPGRPSRIISLNHRQESPGGLAGYPHSGARVMQRFLGGFPFAGPGALRRPEHGRVEPVVDPGVVRHDHRVDRYGLWARDFSRGVTAFVVLFLPQEMYAISKENDAFPPLTHVVRNRFPSWFAFPLIFATVTAVSARWAAVEWRAVGLITLPVAALGWLIEHFLATYAGPDPRREGTAAGGERRAA